MKHLEKDDLIDRVAAICAPGVGNSEILNIIVPICQVHHNILIINESDLYDYLTN
jgi:hypothetical protein